MGRKGGVAQWVVHLTRNNTVSCCCFEQDVYYNCLVLAGFRNGFERKFTFELKYLTSIMEHYLKLKKKPHFQYRQNQTKTDVRYYMMRQCSRRYIIFWHDQSSIRLSIYFSSIVKQSSNPFLEPTSTEQHVKGLLLKETTGALDGTGTHDLNITSQARNHWSMHDGQ